MCALALVFKVLFYIISTMIWCECTDNKKECFPRESETNSTYYVCILRQECNGSLPTIFRYQQRTITCVKERSWKMFFCPRILGFSISILVPGVNRSRGRVWTTVPWPFHILTYTVKVLQMASYFLSGVERGWLPVKSRSHNWFEKRRNCYRRWQNLYLSNFSVYICLFIQSCLAVDTLIKLKRNGKKCNLLPTVELANHLTSYQANRNAIIVAEFFHHSMDERGQCSA